MRGCGQRPKEDTPRSFPELWPRSLHGAWSQGEGPMSPGVRGRRKNLAVFTHPPTGSQERESEPGLRRKLSRAGAAGLYKDL